MGSTSQESADLVRRALALPLGGHRQRDTALVGALAQVAGDTSDPDAARGRLLHLLVDLEQRPLDTAAEQLALEEPEAQRLLAAARRSTGGAPFTASCRGWGLVSRRARLTAAEQRAGTAHLDLCRRCRDSLAAGERARRELLARSTAVAALVAATHAAAAVTGGAAGATAVGGLVLGKATAAVIGTLGAALVVAGAAVATTSSGTTDRTPRPTVVLSPPPQTPGPSPTVRPLPAPRTAGTTCASPCSSAPTPTAARATDDAPAPLPLPLPAGGVQLPGPVEVPVRLPGLPTTLPSLPAVLPSLPAVLPSLAPLPLLPPAP